MRALKSVEYGMGWNGQMMDHGETLSEALWLTAHKPYGDHEALWALCLRSPTTSGINLKHSILPVH